MPDAYHAAMPDPAPRRNASEQVISIEQAYQHCMQVARNHYENFPTASLFIRHSLRPSVAAIYAFARAADDMADEGAIDADRRLKQLDAWEVLLERCEHETVDHPVFMALGDTIRKYELPVSCLHDLLTAFRMDVSIHAYATLDELLFYCRHSANPVGRLILALHGISHPAAQGASDAICTALQLTNFWQDLSRDLPRGRCYLPEEWLAESGLGSAMLLQEKPDMDISGQLRPALEHAVEYTSTLYAKGCLLLPWLPFRLKLQVAATSRGGGKILRAVRHSSDPLRERPALGAGAWPALVLMALMDALSPPYRPLAKTA